MTTTLPYESAQQKVAAEPGMGAVRVTLPANADVRPALVWHTVACVGRIAAPLSMSGLLLRAVIGLPWPHRFIAGVAIAMGLSFMSIAVCLVAAWCAGWLIARRLRPVTVEVGVQTIMVTSWGRRPRVFSRDLVHRVDIARMGRSRFSTVRLFGRFEPVVPNLWHAPTVDAEAAGVALRAALGLRPDGWIAKPEGDPE